MRTSFVCAGMLISSLFVFGCMHGRGETDEALLGRLPMGEKQEVFTAQNNVQAARANLAAADHAVDESRQFGDIANHELSAANSRERAAKEAFRLAQTTGNDETIHAANANRDLAAKEVEAARTKKDYAAKLIDERRGQRELANRELSAADARLSLARAEVLRKNSIQPRENIAGLQKSVEDRRFAVEEQQRRLVSLQKDTARSRQAWDGERRAYDVASRTTITPPPVQPSVPPPPVQPAPMPEHHEPAAGQPCPQPTGP